MKKIISIFKILTFVSFIIILIPNDKGNIAMIGALLALMIGYGGINGLIMSLVVLPAAIFIFINAFVSSRLNYQLSIVSILILYLPVGISIRRVIKNFNFISASSYLIFILISLITLGLIIRRLVTIKNVE